MKIGLKRGARRSVDFTLSCLVLGALLSLSVSSVARSQVPTEATVHIDRAVLAYDGKKYEEALKELQEALRADPQNVEALYYLGVVYLALNRPAEAQGALEKALALRPGNYDVAFQLGILFFNQQDYEKAEPLLRQVYRFEPNRQNLGYYLGFIEYRKKNYREAIAFLQANKPSDDNFAQLARFYSGLAMSAMGFPREGQAEISEALRLQPVSPLTLPAQRFGEILEKAADREKSFGGELRLGVFYDTNVPVVPSSSSDIVVGAIQEDQRYRQSAGQLVTINLWYHWLKKLDWEGTLSYRFLQTNNNNHLEEFNTRSHTPTVGLAYRSAIAAMPLISGAQLTYDVISLGNARFNQRAIFNPYLTLVESQSKEISNLTTLQYRFQVFDFNGDYRVYQPGSPVPDAEVRDAFNYMIGPQHYLLFDEGRHYLKLGYQFDYNDAQGKNWTYAGHRLVFGGQVTIPWGEVRLRYDLDLAWRFHRYTNSLLPSEAQNTVKRRDLEPVHLFSVSKDFLGDFTGAVEYLFDNNKSNLAPFTYKRHVITTTLSWRF